MLNDKRSYMKKERTLHTSITLLLCGLLLYACTPDDTILDATDTENEILFQTGESVATRGFVEDLATEGTKISIYGYHGNKVLAENKKPLAGKSLTYMNQRWAVVDDASADPTKPITYFWEGEDNNLYRFFGWLKADNSVCPHSYDANTMTLTVNPTLNSSYGQFDFLYSGVDERILTADNKRTPVEFNMSHLFSAFSIGITNKSEKDIFIKNVTLRHVDSEGSATINYSDDPDNGDGKVIYNITESTSPFLSYSSNDTGYKLEAKEGLKRNLFDPEADEKTFYMVWPQELPVLTFKNEEEEAKAEDNVFPLVMEYTVGNDPTVVTKRMQIPHSAWEAGKKYSYEVLIADKIVTINYSVQDWDYLSSVVDFKDHSISLMDDAHLDWENGQEGEMNTCIVDDANKKVYVDKGQAVEATFGFNTPQGGQWAVSLTGDIDAFKIIDDVAPYDDGQGPIDNNKHRIKIQPLILSPERDYSVRLKFVVITADDKTYSADDVVQNLGGHTSSIYDIVLPRAN